MQATAALTCDAGRLGSATGLLLMATRMLDRLAPGEVLEILSSEPSAQHDLSAWARLQAHVYVGSSDLSGRSAHYVEKGRARRILTAEEPDWDQRATLDGGRFETAAWLIGRAGRIPDRADPSLGFAPRGAVVERGSPVFPFDVLDAEVAWSDSAAELYEQATASQWDASRDIPWGDLVTIDRELERSVCQIMTFLAENEYSALYVPAQWIPRIHPVFAETVLFMATQVADEARHIEAFCKRALSNGGGLQFSTASTQASLKSLLDSDDFLQACFLLGVLGEGTFLDLLKYVETYAPDPVTREIARRARVDESRHVHFARRHLARAVEADPRLKEKLRRAVLDRAAVLSEVKGLNPLVEESLAVLAAGGLAADRLPQGIAARAELYETMHANRVKRLTAVGFEPREAEELSMLHTPNFM
jgi:TusA-related sulfurtransferase